jgi:beta-glucosidase
MTFLRFPDGFLWGSGTSAHQVEGGNRNNDWWAFEQQRTIANREVSGDAADHYHRYPRDFALAAELKQNAHKLSVEWSRIEPEPGVYDEAALAHYVEVVKTMRASGLAPFVTLHHFTSPLWLGAAGWWEHPGTAERFGAFARVVAERLAPHVEAWITVNEPMAVAVFGYQVGRWPPGRRSFLAALRVTRNLMRAHQCAYDAVKSVDPDAPVGVAVNATAVELSSVPAFWERLLVTPFDWVSNWWYLDRVREKLDFIGLQYYSRATLRTLAFGDPTAGPGGPDLPVSDMGWAIYPQGLRRHVHTTWRRYGLPIYVTENGLADREDVYRKSFIHDHLQALHAAMEDGADVRGYFHWSLIDNFEWRDGFDPRFGLVAIDYATQERRVRESARYYATVCGANGLEVADTGHVRRRDSQRG